MTRDLQGHRNRTIIRVTAYRPAQDGAHSSKNLRIDSSHRDSSNLKQLEPWASKKGCRYRGQGSHMRLYTKCAYNEHLDQENGMRLITNMRL